MVRKSIGLRKEYINKRKCENKIMSSNIFVLKKMSAQIVVQIKDLGLERKVSKKQKCEHVVQEKEYNTPN